MMNNKISDIITYFDEILPNAKCELNYSQDYELLIAVMLSAQATDKSVNQVTEVLFKKYPSLDAFESATREDIEAIIKPVGLGYNKSIHIKEIVHSLINDYNYVVPSSKKDLMSLSGIGNKSANVVRIELFKIPEIPVDTHVERLSKRLNLAKEDDSVLEVENKLKRKIPKDRYIKFHHQMIHFGRYFCSARNPKCDQCKLVKYCSFAKKNKLFQ